MKVKVAEHFYSIQGEGINAGYPAVFIRLSGCNLLCGGPRTQIDKQLHNGATWRCDTIESWMQGTDYELSDFLDLLVQTYDFKNTQIVITGGEPFMQPEVVKNIILGLEERTKLNLRDVIEIETNSTIMPSVDKFFQENPIQYNCSPKLSNSGMDREIRFQLDAIKEFNAQEKTIFKFVISSEKDFLEMEEDFLPHISRERVFLMPACDTKEAYLKSCEFVVELCKKHHLKFSPRHHLMIWDKKTGV